MSKKRDEDWYYNTFLPMVGDAFRKKTNTIMYYEVYIDLEERIDRWYDYAWTWTYLAVECLSNWAIRRDNWYWSPTYINELEKAIKEHNGDIQTALSSIL